jgi:hypothetical protein
MIITVKKFIKFNLIKIFIYLKKIFNNSIKSIKSYFTKLRISEILFKILFLLIILFLCFNIAQFSFKAFLYPIRKSQYFDECSYISMG